MTARRLLGVSVLSMVLAAGTVVAHEGHEHKILGTVTMAAADHVMLQTKEGKEVTVNVTADTKVTKGKEALKAEDLKAGTHRRDRRGGQGAVHREVDPGRRGAEIAKNN